MRLALIRQRYTPYGGAERFVEAALEALLERNVAITLYAREWPDTRLQLIEPHVVDPFYIGRLWRDWSFARAVAREVGRAKIDLVQSHERVLCCDVFRAGDGVHASYLDERLKGSSLLVRAVTRAAPYHRYVLSMERRMFASPWLRAVICNSRMVRDEFRERFAVPESRLHVIYNAVDSRAFHPGLREVRADVLSRLRIPAEAIVFLLVGSGYERKGVATALQALRELPPAAHLVVVGKDKRLARYVGMARELGLESRVTFAGPQDDPKPFFGAADVFVLPTLYDPLPNAALEAMACGLPVITSPKSGAAEIVLAHDAGLVCPSRDVPGLAAQMRTLLDEATRQRMGAHARAAVLPMTPEAMTLELVLLYKELLAESVAQQKADAAKRAAKRRQRFAADAGGTPAEPPAPPAGDDLPTVRPADPAALTRDASAPRSEVSAAELPSEPGSGDPRGPTVPDDAGRPVT